MASTRRIVIGLTGPFGAGCSTIAKDLETRLKWRKYSLTEAMRQLALTGSYVKDIDEKKLNSDRPYQQYVGNEIRRHKIYAIPEKVVEDIEKDDKKNKDLALLDIVVDGIKNPSEMIYLRDRFPNFFVIAVFASFDIRWVRKRDDYDGYQTGFERDDERDAGGLEPPWGQKVQLCVDSSDVLISNDRQFGEPIIKEELQGKLDSYIRLMKEPGSREPHIIETNMAQAYVASLMSSCHKRKVSAVVVKEEYGERRTRSYIIATGYNETPLNIKHCVERGGSSDPQYCYKDEKIKEVLSEQYQFCPQCGNKLEIPKQFGLPLICTAPNCGARLGRDFIPGRMLDLCPAIHAEEAAILQASKFGGTEVDGSILYTTTFPCPLCAKMIVHSGIACCYFAESYPQDEAINALAEGGIEARLFEGVKGRAFHKLFEPPPYK
jgi:deoxycytidylate deaminase